MKLLTSMVLAVLCLSISLYGQDSDQKEEILSVRKAETEKKANREHCAKLGNEALKDNRCFEIYPSDVMNWGKGFSEGLAKITVNGKAGFINANGEIVINPRLKDAGRFSENLAPFESRNGKWGYLNPKGETIIEPKFDWAISFHEGLGLVQVGELWGYVDKSGKIIIEPKFEEASSFQEGSAVIGYYDKNYVWTSHSRPNGKWARRFIDKEGNWFIDKDFDGISRNFDGGMAIASRNLGYSEKFKGVISETYLIDRKGEELWKLNSWWISSFSDDVILVAVEKDKDSKEDRFTYLNRKGERITDKVFSYSSGFSEGLATVKLTFGGKYGVIDKTGEFVIPPSFSGIGNFSEGLASAEKSFGKTGYIDKKGSWVIEPKFSYAEGFKEGLALVGVGDKTGYIDRTGNYIWKPTK